MIESVPFAPYYQQPQNGCRKACCFNWRKIAIDCPDCSQAIDYVSEGVLIDFVL